MCLKLKGLAFETNYLEYPDIEPYQKKNGYERTGLKSDGIPFYTLPTIYDPSTGAKVTDSWNIALYLDKTYPDTPKVLPSGTLTLQRAWADTTFSILLVAFPFIAEEGVAKMPERSAAHWKGLAEFVTRKPFDQITPHGEEATTIWASYKEGMGKIDAWYAAREKEQDVSGREENIFLGGKMPLFADIVLVAYLLCHRRTWGHEGARWKEVCTWHSGRWGRMLRNLISSEGIRLG